MNSKSILGATSTEYESTQNESENVPKEKVDYKSLVQEFGSPLLILDQAEVRRQYRDLVKALPGVQMHYAIKPLPHEAVISTLREEGAGFDLATNGEVDLVRGQSVDPSTCIHTHPIKRAGDIEYALEYGCNVFVFDNIHELEKFKSYRK